MSLRSCECGCGELVEHTKKHPRWYVDASHKQRAYRRRERRAKSLTPIGRVFRCRNCGIPGERSVRRQKFCCASCRSSFWQQQKRISKNGEVGEA